MLARSTVITIPTFNKHTSGWSQAADFNASFRQWFADERLIPVVRTDSADDAMQVCAALVAGGLRSLEITLTTPNATAVIAAFAEHPDVVVGAGSVANLSDALAALDAGARFIVTPISSFEVLSACQIRNVPCVLGALTPTEIAAAFRAGASAVKVFPVSSLGGPSYIRAIRAPLPHIPLMVTGGVTLANASEYLAAGALAVGVGNELVDVAAVRAGRAADVSERARAAQLALRSAKAS